MDLLRLFSSLALMLSVVACATPAPSSLTFGPQSSTALLVAAGPPTFMATTIHFRRVNMETHQFEEEIVSVVNSSVGGNQINRRSNIWLSLRELEGGDYALVSLATSTGDGYAWRCLHSGAPVFSLPDGQISILQLNAYWTGAPVGLNTQTAQESAVLQEFDSARASYPGVVGRGVLVAPSATIRWEGQRGLGITRNCGEPASFSISDGPPIVPITK